jgi:hypothetical protein
VKCKICGSQTADFGTLKLMGKYDASYRRCLMCGFIFAENPYWLPEAYSSAITVTDMGTVSRTDRNSLMTKAIIDVFYSSSQQFLDYGAGYGMFVRRMRDLGYNFYAYDPHCRNMFAEQVALSDLGNHTFDLTTAFEVFEHLQDPAQLALELWPHTDQLLVTTEIVPTPAPPLDEWWYYAPEHGQHVSFFTLDALRIIGEAGNRNLCSNGANLHLFSRGKVSNYLFNKVTSERASQWIGLWRRRRSLLEGDWHKQRADVLTSLGYEAAKYGR